MFVIQSGGAGDLISLVTGQAGSIDVHVTWADLVDAATTATPGRSNTATISTATTTTIVAAPGANTKRSVNFMSIRNRHASVSVDCTLKHTDGANNLEVAKFTLLAGEYALFNGSGVFFIYDTSGGVKSASSIAASDTQAGNIEIAIQSEMETATDVVRATTPGRQHFHPGHPKCWLKCGVTANILASYNITSLTDTGTGDVAVTINVDFSGADYPVAMSVQRTNSTAAAANARQGTIKTGSLAAGTFSMDCWDDTATTNVLADPTSWHFIACGDLA